VHWPYLRKRRLTSIAGPLSPGNAHGYCRAGLGILPNDEQAVEGVNPLADTQQSCEPAFVRAPSSIPMPSSMMSMVIDSTSKRRMMSTAFACALRA